MVGIWVFFRHGVERDQYPSH